MGYYDIQQVCLNGHQITDSYNDSPERRKDFCNICGEKTIYRCPKCHFEIRGRYHIEGAILSMQTSVPICCDNCGAPYPWTEKRKTLTTTVGSDATNSLKSIENICKRFHKIVVQLRSRYGKRPTLKIEDEYDVQYLFHALLRLFFNDIKTEEWTPSYAGSSSRMDFLLKNEAIVVEVKKTRNKLENKEIGDQLIIDIERYQEHPKCKTLFCFIYDPESKIKNPEGLERDLSRNEKNITVKVSIIPKGY